LKRAVRWNPALRTLLLASLFAPGSLLAPPGLSSQEPVPGATLPREVRDGAIQFLNAPTTLRLSGGSRIPAGTAVEGDVGVLGGGLLLSGRIRGRLLVVNGDLRLGEGAEVEGDLTVVGGRVFDGELLRAGGEVRVYQAPLRYRLREDRVEAEEVSPVEPPDFLSVRLGPARVRGTLRTAGNYNRVEGFPVLAGPVLEAGGRNPLLLEAFGIWRSVEGLDLETGNLGYRLRAEQGLGGSGELLVGLRLHSEVVPVEDRGLSDAEASLSTFLLRRDVRDYFERKGWSAALLLRPVDRPLRFEVTYREEDHEGVPVREPWTLRDGTRPWRPLAVTAEGPLRSLELQGELDTRDDPGEPASGWWIQARVRRAVGGDLRLPDLRAPGVPLPPLPPGSPGPESGEPFPLALDGRLDLRRYNRLGPDSRLHLRLLAAGSLDGTPLPPQHQVTLGGEGTLPGHPRFSADCGARALVLLRGEEEVHPMYGCDRILLGQVEYHGYFPFSWSPGARDDGAWEWGALLDLRPAWTLFLNAGRGWALEGAPATTERAASPLRADVGAGLHLGPLGLYWAYPLNRRDQGVNFFVRLQHRF
jgi:hypothetical protein